jgi:gas vesicle protein
MKNFLSGLAAGIAIGYLTAPRSGKETREQLSDTVDGMKEQWEEAKIQITELIEDVKAQVGISTADDLANKAHNKFDQYSQEANHVQELAMDQYNDTIDQYNDKVDEWADAAKSGINTAENNLKI